MINPQPTIRPIRRGDPALLLRLEQDGDHEISGTVTAADVPRLLRDIANQLETKYGAAGCVAAPAPQSEEIADVLARLYDQTPLADLPDEFAVPHRIAAADILETLRYAHVSGFTIPGEAGPIRVLRIVKSDCWGIFNDAGCTWGPAPAGWSASFPAPDHWDTLRWSLPEALQIARQLAAGSIPAGDA